MSTGFDYRYYSRDALQTVIEMIETIPANLSLANHQQAIVGLLDEYSRDSMGDGKPLPDDVKRRLIPGLREHPTTIIFLAYDGDRPVGIIVCFRGYSTFQAKPLINIHDIAVLSDYRGKGIGKRLLETAADHARTIGCCKLTLETQEHNYTAQKLYKSVGFARDVHTAEAGGAIFMTMKL